MVQRLFLLRHSVVRCRKEPPLHPLRIVLAISVSSVLLGDPASAQGFSPPGGQLPQPGMAGAGMDQSGSSTATRPDTVPGAGPGVAPGFGSQSPGFSAQPAPQPQEPARQNFADELTDFGIRPQDTLQDNVGSPTPVTVPGGHLITTAEMRRAVGSDILIVDVLAAPPHPTLPGALLMPGAGNGGSFDDALQQQFWSALSQAARMNPNQPIVFLCAGSRCWESYNAALRAEHMGFKMVLWYRGGLASWQAAGLPLTMPGSRPPAAPARSPGFGANPG